MPENDKTGTEENFNLHCVQDGRKAERKKCETLLTSAIVPERLERNTRLLLNNRKNNGNQILIFSDEITFTVDPVFNTQNDRVLTFENNASEHHRMSTIKHTASIMMLDVVASNGEKMPLVWLEQTTG